MAGLRAAARALAALCLALALGTGQEATGQATGQATGGEAAGPVTKLPLPRYVSLRSDKVNARRGPGLDYPIDWVFQRAGLPVRVVDEYGHWRRIVDSDDAGGWVYHSLLTGRRTALITETQVAFRAEPAEAARRTAEAERGVVARLIGCRPDWCELEVRRARGWVPKAAIWGVEPEETFGR